MDGTQGHPQPMDAPPTYASNLPPTRRQSTGPEEMMMDPYAQRRMSQPIHPIASDVYNNPIDRRSSYHDPYQMENPYSAPTGTISSTSLGPWDSASQRSVSHVSFPIQQPHSAPLSDSDGSGGYGSSGRHVRNKPSVMTAGGLSYIDEEGDYYRSAQTRPASTFKTGEEHEMRGLVPAAAGMGHGGRPGSGGGNAAEYRPDSKYTAFEESPYNWPPMDSINMRKESKVMSLLLFPTGLDRVLSAVGWNKEKMPVEQMIDRKKHGIPGQRFPVMSWILTAAMTGVLIYEVIRNNALTGSPIAIQPSFNYMIGPSPSVLINIGARFPPCMKLVEAIPPTFNFACLNDLGNPPTTTCSLATICGHGMTTTGTPNQTWRFFVPIFLHVGVVHLLLNMIAQLTAGAFVEREIGSIPYLIIYFAGGIYGFILGGNFGRVGVPSAGASGALFAVNACVLVDLILHWKYEERPKLKAFFLAVEFVIGIAIGYIPNAVDGLAHLGGFAMGLLLGVVFYPSIHTTKRRRFTLWGIRVAAVVLAVVAFVLTTKNFYTKDPNAACTWCKYLSCIPIGANDYCSGTGLVQTTVQATRRTLGLL